MKQLSKCNLAWKSKYAGDKTDNI